MKKICWWSFIFLLSVSLFGCAYNMAPSQEQQSGNTGISGPSNMTEEPEPQDKTNEEAVVKLIEEFGKKLQMVPLQAPQDIVSQGMRENYGDYVTPALLEKWQNDPQQAPGRLVSSPWPDRIEVLAVEKTADDTYQVEGEIIEITSVEQESGGAAAKRPITAAVKKHGERWLIDTVTMGDYETEIPGSIVYENSEYGFRFSLPDSWKGYSIVTNKWEGLATGGAQNGKVVESGPLLSIRHPQWTAEKPRQDIPVMIFTLDQWNALQQGSFHIGAAPVGPRELGRNSEFVFALPARYNYEFPEGYEEVEEILSSDPLQPFERN